MALLFAAGVEAARHCDLFPALVQICPHDLVGLKRPGSTLLSEHCRPVLPRCMSAEVRVRTHRAASSVEEVVSAVGWVLVLALALWNARSPEARSLLPDVLLPALLLPAAWPVQLHLRSTLDVLAAGQTTTGL